MTTGTDTTETTRSVAIAFYDAILRADVAELMGYLSEDIAVHEPPFLPYGGEYTGINALMGLLKSIARHLDSRSVDVHELIVDGEIAIAIVTMPDRRTGRPVQLAERCQIRDGKIVDLTVFIFEPQSLLVRCPVVLGPRPE